MSNGVFTITAQDVKFLRSMHIAVMNRTFFAQSLNCRSCSA
jgi:hypothetical protein